MYQKCAKLWHTLSVAEKREWEALGSAKHMTGFAYWQSQCLRPNPGIYLPLQGGTMQGAILMDGYHIHGLPLPIHVQDVWRRQDFQDFCLPYHMTHGARVYASLGQTLGNGVHTPLPFDLERYDTDAIHDTVVNNSRLTCKTAGKYIITGNVYWETHAVGKRLLYIRLGGVTRIAMCSYGLNSDNEQNHFVSSIYDLAVNDYLELVAMQNSGGNLIIFQRDNYSLEFMMQRIGA